MTTTDPKAEALLAAAAVTQQQALLDTATGKGWHAVNVFDILMLVSLVVLWWTAQNRSEAAFAGFAVLSAYLAINIHVHRRVRALLRLIEVRNQVSVSQD